MDMDASVAAVPEPETRKTGKAGQLVVALIIFLGFAALLFVPNGLAAGTYSFDSSLFSILLSHFTDGSAADGLLYQLSVYVLIGFYAVTLILTIVSICAKRGGIRACSAIIVLLGMAATAFFAYANISAGIVDGWTSLLASDTTFISLNALFLSFLWGGLWAIILTFIQQKGFGVIKVVTFLLACSFLAVVGKDYIDGYIFPSLLEGIDLGTGTLDTVMEIVFQVLAYVVILNVVVTAICLFIRRTGFVDILRSVIVFVVAVGAFILLGVDVGFSNGLSCLGTVTTAFLALIQLLYIIILCIILRSGRKNAEEAAEPAVEAVPEEEETPEIVTTESNQMAFSGYETEQPAYEAEPAYDPEKADRINQAFEDAAQMTIEDIPAAEEEEAAPEEEPAAEEEEPVYEEAEEEPQAEESFDYEQAQYDSQFNRAYEDLKAAQEAQQAAQEAYEQQQAAYEQQQAYAQQQAYGQQQPYGQQTYAQQQPYGQQTPPPYYYQASPAYGQQGQPNPYYNMNNAGYVPDAFINGLTPSERDEFNKIFISRIYGENKRLPQYVVGGDNREFFTKVFVFMGKYRTVMSDGLIQKIYDYSNLIK